MNYKLCRKNGKGAKGRQVVQQHIKESYYLVCYNVNDDDVSVKCSFYRKSKNFICLATIIASFT